MQTRRWGWMTAAIAALVIATTSSARPADIEDWPRVYSARNGTAIVIHQPQVERWDDFRTLEALMAVEVQLPDVRQSMIGAIVVRIETETDHAQRRVTLRDPKVIEMDFPVAKDADAKRAKNAVRRLFPSEPTEIELDRILAGLQRRDRMQDDVEVAHDLPKLIVSDRDALLVRIDGPPIFERVGDMDLSIAVNTISDLLRDDATGMFYLKRDDNWLMAPALEGPWQVNRRLPEVFFRIPDNARLHDIRRGVRGRSPQALANPPAVYVAQEPAELIVTYGSPKFETIPGTQLRYITNSESDIFRYEGDGKYYALFSGRWYRKTPDSDERPEYCSDDLPPEFAKIPADHDAGRVLASVPGTQQAHEAALSSRIPRTAVVDRDEAKFEATYEGPATFKPIAGTNLAYADNTSFEVLRVDGRYYACHQAVWFEADAPEGPWSVCDDVPAAVYTIPSSSHLYPVTYVQVYDSNLDEVVVGYRPGYEGSFLSGGVLVYGLGIDYHLPRSYYTHRHRAWTDGNFKYARLRETYGHGYHYDHLSGMFRRSKESRAHHAAREVFTDPYAAWGDSGVVVSRFNAGDAPVLRGMVARRAAAGAGGSGHDLYATRGGAVYRNVNTGWQRHESGGWSGYRPSGAAQRNVLNQARSSREWGMHRESAYRRYRGTRGTRGLLERNRLYR